MSIQHIDKAILREISAHTRSLGLKHFFQSLAYERCGELPLITSRLAPRFSQSLRYLDIGSGEAVYPSYLLKKTKWDITCVDKFDWVQRQWSHAARSGVDYAARFHVLQSDFLATELEPESFDVITNISVIEHFENTTDADAMRASAKLLRPGGLYLLCAPFNEGNYREFYLKSEVYGEEFKDVPVFYQRHFDTESFYKRVVEPSGLKEVERIYYGDYDFQFKELFTNVPWPWKPVKILYQWATPVFASRFLTYRDRPVSRPGMDMNTSSGVLVVLGKDK